ncbi:MAG: insulinase family protein [Acidimicrobiia bacterium]|nr:insulinase family protein [Acidimicrobiia bacterium]
MIERTTLANGIRVVIEHVPGVRSVACGVWVDVGSRDEAAGERGASHFLEHLLFKGTERWSALEIASALDAVGGEFNAFTSKEYTVFFVRTLDSDIVLGLDILADITQRPALREDDIASERNVVLEEILMYEDSPDELVHDTFAAAIMPDHPLGLPVLGTRESIEGISRDGIRHHFTSRYTPDRTILAVAGNVDPEAFVTELDSRWGGAEGEAPARELPAPAGALPIAVDRRDTEQAHLVLGVEAMPRDDPRRHALALLAHTFGGGMSSRLFQEVREKRGLVYAVYAYRSLFAETGWLASYAGTAPGRAEETLDVLSTEWDKLAAGFTRDELEAAKSHVRGGLALSQEDTGARMTRIGRSEITLDEVPDIDEVVRRIDAVTLDELNELAAELGARPRTLAAIGPLDAALLGRVA